VQVDSAALASLARPAGARAGDPAETDPRPGRDARVRADGDAVGDALETHRGSGSADTCPGVADLSHVTWSHVNVT